MCTSRYFLNEFLPHINSVWIEYSSLRPSNQNETFILGRQNVFNQKFKSNVMSVMLCRSKSFMCPYTRQDLCFFLGFYWHSVISYYPLFLKRSWREDICMQLKRERWKDFCTSQYNTQSAFSAFKTKQIISPLLLMQRLACERRRAEPLCLSHVSWWSGRWGDALSTPPALRLKRIRLRSAPALFYFLLYPSRVKLQSGLLILPSLE